MRTKTDHLRVEIQEATEATVRSFTITVTAPQDCFQLADMLRTTASDPTIQSSSKANN
ncbi:MAG TPA: hypothetical protein VGQ39_03090 [Pyrinomonadaceae bacterium]|nr:hypothetical protein [Pyrinomonadaceae bacterium]